MLSRRVPPSPAEVSPLSPITPFLWFESGAEEVVSFVVRCETQPEIDRYMLGMVKLDIAALVGAHEGAG